MIIRDWNELIPGFREAVEKENRERDVPWLGLTEFIAGVEVLPFTPRHYLILTAIGSPFLLGGAPTAVEVIQFLWIVSPGFIPGRSMCARWHRWKFVRRNRKLDWASAVKAIDDYLDGAFENAIGGSVSAKSYFSSLAGIVDCMASEYGWTEDEILKTPFKKLFQLNRSRRMRTDPDVTLVNPSDRLKSEYLLKLRKDRN